MEEQPEGKSKSKVGVGVIIAIVLVSLCCCVIILAAAGVVAYEVIHPVSSTTDIPGSPFGPTTATPVVEVTRPPVADVSTETLETLKSTIVPENDPTELACRLKGICDIPATMEPPVAPRQAGDKDTFWVVNIDTNENFQVDATLEYVTPHVYFWVEDGVRYNEDELKALADTFENQIYPTDREFFGSEWTPGIDGDVHLMDACRAVWDIRKGPPGLAAGAAHRL